MNAVVFKGIGDPAILLSDIFPTGYFSADNAEIEPGDTVDVFGCGPVGQFASASAKLMDAGRILAVEAIPSRLEMALQQGADAISAFKAFDTRQSGWIKVELKPAAAPTASS